MILIFFKKTHKNTPYQLFLVLKSALEKRPWILSTHHSRNPAFKQCHRVLQRQQAPDENWNADGTQQVWYCESSRSVNFKKSMFCFLYFLLPYIICFFIHWHHKFLQLHILRILAMYRYPLYMDSTFVHFPPCSPNHTSFFCDLSFSYVH